MKRDVNSNPSFEDIREVTNQVPDIRTDIKECKSERVILMATIGKSELLDCLEKEGKLSLEQVRGKREVYLLKQISSPFA